MALREDEEEENRTPREDPDDPGHIWRSPREHFNQRTLFLAERFHLKQQDIKDAYKDKSDGYKEIKDLFLTAQDARTLKNFFFPFLTLFVTPVAVTVPEVGCVLLAAALWGGYHNHRKHENVGETLRKEVEKAGRVPSESQPAP